MEDVRPVFMYADSVLLLTEHITPQMLALVYDKTAFTLPFRQIRKH
jgi:hypothetical protein